ncbi:hypothetical protein ACFWG6_04475 [Streptomyces erythrochromogenes]
MQPFVFDVPNSLRPSVTEKPLGGQAITKIVTPGHGFTLPAQPVTGH